MSTHLPEDKGAAVPAITVCPARLAHLSAIAELLAETGCFYGTASAGSADEQHRQVREALFAALRCPCPARLGSIPARRDRCVLVPVAAVGLKDLYVATRYGRRGIGTLLMRSLIEVASEHGCSRVEWTADTDSATAQAFYSKLGLPPLPSKIFYRIEDDGSGLQLPS